MLVLVINILFNLGSSNMFFPLLIARELREAQQACSPQEEHGDPGVSGTPTGPRSTKRLVGGKSAKSSSFTCGKSSP